MATQTKVYYPRTVTQTTGGKYAKWNDLNVIKATNNGYAQTVKIDGKSKTPNRPSTVTCTDFNMKIPVGAVVTKVVVEYKHVKAASSGKYNNIPAPTVSLMHNGSVIEVQAGRVGMGELLLLSHKSAAPKATVDTRTPTWNGTERDHEFNGKKYDFYYELPSRDVFNSTSFGVRINYPSNTNANAGYLRLYWVRVRVTYVEASYSLSAQRVYGGINHDGTLNPTGGYNHMEYRLKARINRTSKTSYVPKVTITVPVGFTFKGATGVVQKNVSTLEWTPSLPSTKATGSANVELPFDVNVTYASGQTSYNASFELVESLNDTTVTHSTTIIDRPDAPASETGDDDSSSAPIGDTIPNEVVPCVVGEWVNFPILFPKEWVDQLEDYDVDDYGNTVYALRFYNSVTEKNYPIKIKYGESVVDLKDVELNNLTKQGIINADYVFPYELQVNTVGKYDLKVYFETREEWYDDANNWVQVGQGVSVLGIPTEESLTTPSMTILQPTSEELNRLGNNHKYTVQSNIKLTTSLSYVPDWYKNFRIGVFNNPIEDNITRTTYTDENGEEKVLEIDSTNYETLTIDDIFENAEYWSNAPTTPNKYESLECQFMHDKDYPLYILLVGDYPEGNQSSNTIRFTEPCIVETAVYKGRETNGTFPIPINNLINNDNDTAELVIEALGASNNFTISELPLDEGTGTNETTAIRGLELTGNIEVSDELILYAKLTNPKGETGQRSIILSDVDTTTDGDNSFTIGGIGDLWGFNILDIQDLEDWEIELGISNTLMETEGHLNFGDLTLNIYTETIDPQRIQCYINNENLAFYGLFLTDLQIPPGLNTDVSFLTIEGTDTNDAYRQNIREKTITVEFEIGENCDLEMNTQSLRQLTKVLTNEKDQYNRPIPKRITFSHLPDVYYEYIIEDSPEINIEIGTYKVKAKLVIPSGTAYSKNSTTTNTFGYVQGLAKIRPTITARPTDELIEIRETRSGQKFNIGYTGQWTDKIIEIDCENRIVWLKTDEDDTDPVNITKYCDYNSDWFSLHGEYVFEGTNCVIRTIDYIERW